MNKKKMNALCRHCGENYGEHAYGTDECPSLNFRGWAKTTFEAVDTAPPTQEEVNENTKAAMLVWAADPELTRLDTPHGHEYMDGCLRAHYSEMLEERD